MTPCHSTVFYVRPPTIRRSRHVARRKFTLDILLYMDTEIGSSKRDKSNTMLESPDAKQEKKRTFTVTSASEVVPSKPSSGQKTLEGRLHPNTVTSRLAVYSWSLRLLQSMVRVKLLGRESALEAVRFQHPPHLPLLLLLLYFISPQ